MREVNNEALQGCDHTYTYGSCYQGPITVAVVVSPTRWMDVLPCLASYGPLNSDQGVSVTPPHTHTQFPSYICIEASAACLNIHVSPPSETLPLQICANAQGCEAMCECRILAAFPMSSPGSPSGCGFHQLPV